MRKPPLANSGRSPGQTKERNVMIAEPEHATRILSPLPPVTPVERILSTHPFLNGMTPHQLRLLADFAMPAHFGRDELIFREGDPANRFYLLQSGIVSLESCGNAKGRVRI